MGQLKFIMLYVGGLGTIQSGEARSRGVELEAKAALSPDLSVVAGYTYLDAKYVKDESGLTGKRLVGLPRNTVSLWADHRPPLPALRGLGLGAGVRFFDESTNTANNFAIDGATPVDASVTYDLDVTNARLEGANLYLNAKNLFDQKYATCFYGDTSGSSNWCSYGYQRTVIGGLRYRW